MNFLLLSAAVCAKKIDQLPVGKDMPVDSMPVDTVPETFQEGTESAPIVDIFKISGPVNGVCSSEFNSHPMAMKSLDKDSIVGKWKTVLVDAEMLNRAYVP